MRTWFLVFITLFVSTKIYAKEVRVHCQNNIDDAARINEAISRSEIGDEIVIDGPALINQTIKLVGQRSYRGESRSGTVLVQAKDANLVALMASDSFLDNSSTTGLPVSIRHFTLEGNKTNNSVKTAGIILRSWLSVVEDIQVRDMGGDGIRLTNLSSNATPLKNTQVNGRIAQCFVTDSGSHGIYIQDSGNSCTDWILRDNWIANSGLDGIHMENAAGWYIEGNHIYGVPRHGIYADRAYATSISNNYIEGFGESGVSTTFYGIGVTLQGGAGSTISRNRIFNFGGEKRPQSEYSYLAVIRVNYGDGVANVNGNIMGGSGKANSIGLNYQKGDRRDTTLTVTSSGNSVKKMGKTISVGTNVTQEKGL